MIYERGGERFIPREFLGLWNLYFIIKLVFYWQGYIGFHAWHNLAFATVLLLPIETMYWRRIRNNCAIPFALALLYFDSWLPPLSRLISQTYLLSDFDTNYLIELIGRVIDIRMIAITLLIWVMYKIFQPLVKFGGIVVGAMLLIAIMGQSGTNEAIVQKIGLDADRYIDQKLSEFFATEALRTVVFPKTIKTEQPLDIIFLHICSLSWDDLKSVGLAQHPLWSRFDYLFTRFNSAASYSGPAAIRLLRSNCGQQTIGKMFDPVSARCLLMPSLEQVGFKQYLAMNHDGHFDEFLKLINREGINVPPLNLDGMQVSQYGFDESLIYDDLAVLSKWINSRAQDGHASAALFYNSISLHDGNRRKGDKTSQSSLGTYQYRAKLLLDQLNLFFDLLEKSDRRSIVVLVPEHGAGVKGDQFQFAGLREIPSPSLTLVPVGSASSTCPFVPAAVTLIDPVALPYRIPLVVNVTMPVPP